MQLLLAVKSEVLDAILQLIISSKVVTTTKKFFSKAVRTTL